MDKETHNHQILNSILAEVCDGRDQESGKESRTIHDHGDFFAMLRSQDIIQERSLASS